MSDNEARAVVAYNLCRLRGDRSYLSLAKECETSAGAIRNIELGDRMPGVGLLTRLAKALEVDLAEFVKPIPRTRRKTA